MAVKVTIQFEGIGEVLNRLTEIDEKAEHNTETIVKDLADDTEKFWQANSPKRKGRLREGEKTHPMGLTFTFTSSAYYYDWVSDGHNTPKGWHRRTKEGHMIYIKARDPHWVEGQELTKKATDFVEQNLKPRLSKFLDNV